MVCGFGIGTSPGRRIDGVGGPVAADCFPIGVVVWNGYSEGFFGGDERTEVRVDLRRIGGVDWA